jgi:hypothetical protein
VSEGQILEVAKVFRVAEKTSMTAGTFFLGIFVYFDIKSDAAIE